MSDDRRRALQRRVELMRQQESLRGQASQQRGPFGMAYHPMASVNEGIARGVDGMAGLANRPVNWAMRQLGGDDAPQLSETPTRDVFERGVEVPVHGLPNDPTRTATFGGNIATLGGEEPESAAGRFGVGAGEAAAYMIPFAGGARALSGGGGLLGGAASRLNAPLVSAPATTMAAELGAGGGARVAEDAISDRFGEEYGPAGAVAGGLLGGMAPVAATQGAVARGGRAALNWGARQVAPFTERGARQIAGDRLRGVSADPDQALANLEEPSLGNLSPAQRTGEPGVMALERTVADTDPRFARAREAQQDASSDALRASAREIGDNPAVARQYFEAQLEQARDAAARRLSMIEPERRAGANAAIVREELDSAFTAAKQTENQIWSEVPQVAVVPTQRARQTFEEIVQTTPRAKADEIPQLARSLLGEDGLGAAEPVSEVYGLYSRLGQMVREEAAKPAPNRSIISNLTRMRGAILEDLGAVGDEQTAVGSAINRARNYSRELADTFEAGTVGRLLGATRQGGDRVDPNLTLEAALGSGGSRGAVGARDITDAAAFGGDGSRLEATQGAVEDFMRGRFVDRAARDGQINPDRARDFMQRERETLDRFPSLAEQFSGAEQAARSAADLQSSPGGAFIGTRPGEEVARTVFGRNVTDPQEAARSLYRQATADETGQAVRGLKGGAVDYVMSAATTGARGDPQVSGRAMRNTINENRGALSEILSDDEIRRLDRVGHEFAKLEQARSGGLLAGDLVDHQPNRIIEYLARVVAARSGAQMGAGTSGASLQAAGMASNRVRDMMQRLQGGRAEALLRDAVQDEDLMRSLFSEMSSRRKSDRAFSAVEQWLTSSAQGIGATEASEGARGLLAD